MMMRIRGFTLLEIVAVVSILGLLAGAVAWSLAAEARRGSQAAAVGQIAHADRTARLAARLSGRPCELRFDLSKQRVSRLGPAGRSSQNAHTQAVPDGWRIEQIVLSVDSTRGAVSSSSSAGVTHDSGEVTIVCGPGGRSAGYALRLIDDGGRDALWLVFCGLTGQMVYCDGNCDVQNLFTTSRVDAG